PPVRPPGLRRSQACSPVPKRPWHLSLSVRYLHSSARPFPSYARTPAGGLTTCFTAADVDGCRSPFEVSLLATAAVNYAAGRFFSAQVTVASTSLARAAHHLEQIRRRDRELRHPNTDCVRNGVGHSRRRRHDRHFGDTAHAVRMAGVRDFDDDRVDQRQVEAGG